MEKAKSFVSSLLHRGEHRMPAEAQHAFTMQTIASELQKREDDIAFKQLEATRYDVLHDDKKAEFWERLIYEYGVVLNDASGKYEVHRTGIDYDMLALFNTLSHVHNASFLSKDAADLIQIKMRHMLRRVRMNSNPETYNSGVANFLKSVEIDMLFVLGDAIEGKKARLLLNPTKGIDVNVQPQQSKPKEVM